MKIQRLALALGLLALGAPAQAAEPAPAPPSDYYAGIALGLYAPTESTPILTRPTNAPQQVHTNFGAGYTGEAKLGYRMSDSVRTELEVGYRRASLHHMADTDATGSQSAFSVMGNVLFDIGGLNDFGPYIGGGLGGAILHWGQVQPHNSTVLTGPLPLFDDTSSALFQYQAIAGVTFALHQKTKLFVEYHFVGTSGANFQTVVAPGAVATFTHQKDTSHNLMVGVRFSFAGP